MPVPVIMPKFGMTQEDGTIIRWLKESGESVEKGEPILEVQTDKVDMEVEAPAAGILYDLRFGPDAVVPVTTLIAQIAVAGESIAESTHKDDRPAAAGTDANAPSTRRGQRASPVAQRVAEATGVDLAAVTGTGPAGRITKQDVTQAASAAPGAAPAEERRRATPAARRIGRERAVDLTTVAGSGPGGRIQAADVEAALAARPARPAPDASVDAGGAAAAEGTGDEMLRGRRRTIATRLSQSWQSIPHIFLSSSVDMTQVNSLTAMLSSEIERRGGKLTPTIWVARATAVALLRHQRLNAWLLGDDAQGWRIRRHAVVALGIAVALEDGLIVPVVRDAQAMGIAALAVQVAELARLARAGKLTPDAVTGSTFTISNLGMYPVEHFTAIINPPEVGILAVGRARMEPVWNGTAFEPRSTMQMTLSADHRAVDGAVAAAFLAEVKQLLEEPAQLLL
ncbi:MAG: 2-oxo acid dehydrogenase subunit E2 [Caldilinea sp.]|nr:2-oxo acid dehydrogenase subunit E2 [Caldilinea sp.]